MENSEKSYPNFKVFSYGFEGYKPNYYFPHPQLGADCICLRSLQNRETKQPFMPQRAFCPGPRKRQTIQTNDGGMISACMTAVKLSKFSRKTEACRIEMVCINLNSNWWKPLTLPFCSHLQHSGTSCCLEGASGHQSLSWCCQEGEDRHRRLSLDLFKPRLEVSSHLSPDRT